MLAGPVLYDHRRRRRAAVLVARVRAGAARRAQRLLRVPQRAAGTAVPGGAAPAQGVRRALVLLGQRTESRVPARGARVRQAAARRRRADAAARRCSRRSTASTRRATSGTGAPTSSRRSPTRRSRSTPSTAPRCRPGSRRCTCTRSTGPRPAWAPDETPWAYRDAKWAQVIVGVDPDPANAGAIRDWCVDYWNATHPYSMGGAYVNFMMDEGQDRVRATYGDNYDAAGAGQAGLRPRQLLPRQPEHPTDGPTGGSR